MLPVRGLVRYSAYRARYRDEESTSLFVDELHEFYEFRFPGLLFLDCLVVMIIEHRLDCILASVSYDWNMQHVPDDVRIISRGHFFLYLLPWNPVHT